MESVSIFKAKHVVSTWITGCQYVSQLETAELAIQTFITARNYNVSQIIEASVTSELYELSKKQGLKIASGFYKNNYDRFPATDEQPVQVIN